MTTTLIQASPVCKFVVAWTVLLFIAGALVTSNNAALSVPDWPKSLDVVSFAEAACRGAFFEHSHRVIAGGLGIFLRWRWRF